jgi:hypothetical protein
MFILYIIAGMILVFGSFLLTGRIQYIRNGIITEATVIDLAIVKSTNSDDSDTLYLTFNFQTSDNEDILYVEDSFSANSAWQIGDKATIVYQTYNPQRVVFLTYWSSFGLVTVLFSLALVLILIAAGYYWSQHFFNSL